jgi:hypothetical protein
MKVQNKTIYRCDYCNKLYLRRNACVEHEELCWKNPKNNRACYNCHCLTKEDTSYYEDSFYGEIERILKLFYCRKKKIYLYTHLQEKKKNWFDLGDDINEPMPIDCDLQETINHD